MVPFLSGLVLTPLNKMVMQNENIVTFLMLSALFSFLPFFLGAFRVRPHSLLCTPLIVFLHQLHITNHHLSFFMVKLLTTSLFGFWLYLLCLFSSSWMNKAPVLYSSLLFPWLWCISKGVSLLWSHFSSPSYLPSCWVLGTSSFHESLAVSDSSSSESPIFTDLFLPLYPELVENSSTSAASPDDSSLILSPAYDSPVLDPVAPPSLESPIGPKLCRSTWVSILPPYLIDYHYSFVLATLYKPHTYREAHTDPLW